MEIDSIPSAQDSLICFVCNKTQNPNKVSIIMLKSHQLDASATASRFVLVNSLLKALNINSKKNIKYFNNFQFPFCRECLSGEIIPILKLREKLAQIQKDLKLLVDKVKQTICSTTTGVDQIYYETLTNDDFYGEVEEENPRMAFRKSVIIDVKNIELLALKLRTYKKVQKKNKNNRKNYLINAIRRDRLIRAKLKMRSDLNINPGSTPSSPPISHSNVIVLPNFDPSSPTTIPILKSENDCIENEFTQNNIGHEGAHNNIQNDATVNNIENANSENNDENDNADNDNIEVDEDESHDEVVENQTFDESLNQNSGNEENESSNENEEQYNTTIPESFKDFQTDYEKECIEKNIDLKRKKLRGDNDEVPQISEIFGPIPKSLFGSPNGNLAYESYEIKCIESPVPLLECVTCNKQFDVSQIKKRVQHTNPFTHAINHIRAYHNGEFNCKKCNLMFMSKYCLWIHVKNSKPHQPITALITCEVCGKPSRGFHCKIRLKRHVWTHKSVEEKNALIAAGEKEPSAEVAYRNRAKKSSCPICGKMVKILKEHLLRHSSDNIKPQHECKICGKKFKYLETLKAHIKNLHEGGLSYKFFCRVCEKNFSSKLSLEMHKHLRMCSICSKPLRNTPNLKETDTAHVRCLNRQEYLLLGPKPRRKKIEPTPECTICGKIFKNCKYLRYHIRKTHRTEVPKYKCDFCNLKFLRNSELKKHANIHTKEIKYTCSFCGIVKYAKRNLNAHLKTCPKANDVKIEPTKNIAEVKRKRRRN